MGVPEVLADHPPREGEQVGHAPEQQRPTRRAMLSWSMVALAGGRGSPPARVLPADRLAIVVSLESPIRALSHFELRKLYLGAHIENGAGQRIMPFNQP